ncbi:MAG: TlpA disulfide reductase family protein [SAR324 cluster bacterium]|nr:TlpA disulfide reductase family protein [SAR324 cluster bacterium]
MRYLLLNRYSFFLKLTIILLLHTSQGWAAPSPLSEEVQAMLESERIDAPKVELAAADFEGILLNGQTFRLSDQKGKVVFLNFWATWCSPCLKEMPDMQELQKELGSKILVLAVGMGEAAERIEKFQKKHQFEFQILPDPEMTVTQLYGVRNIPITYLVNTSGIVVGRALGPREWTRPILLEFFENLASEKPNP